MNELWVFLRSRRKANLLMVTVNILVFLVLSILGDTESGTFLLEHGAMYVPLIHAEGESWRLLTSMFLHFGLQHLVYNMLLLLFMGDVLERHIGSLCYLIIYLGGGLAGNLLSMAVELRTGSFAVSAGASGAVFAVIGALVFLVIRGKGRLAGISGRRLILMAVLSIAEGFTVSGVDNMAHIGGFLGGFLLCMMCNLLIRRDRY